MRQRLHMVIHGHGFASALDFGVRRFDAALVVSFSFVCFFLFERPATAQREKQKKAASNRRTPKALERGSATSTLP
jgi:hypothetical protein